MKAGFVIQAVPNPDTDAPARFGPQNEQGQGPPPHGQDIEAVAAEDEAHGADHAGDYVVLPVRIRVAWRGVSGDRILELVTALSRGR